METMPKAKHALPLKSLNHVSRVCRDVLATTNFYEHVLGFSPIKRPGSFDFDGAWKVIIQVYLSDSMEKVEQALQDHGVKYEMNTIEENGIVIEQVFFHDPDVFMIEICTCEKFPVQPLNVATAELCNLVRTLSHRKSGLPISRPMSRTNTAEKLIPDQLKAC